MTTRTTHGTYRLPAALQERFRAVLEVNCETTSQVLRRAVLRYVEATEKKRGVK